jgi:hypothetical protein
MAEENLEDKEPVESGGPEEAKVAEPQAQTKSELEADQAGPKTETKAEPATAPKSAVKNNSGLTIIDLGIGVLLLTVLAFLAVNVYVLYIASDYNNRICRNSIEYVKVAVMDGRDTDSIVRAAYGCMDRCALGGFFVEHPQLTLVNDVITADLRTVTVGTSTRALVPAAFLIIDKSKLDDDGQHLTFNARYRFELRHPKNCQGSHKLRIPGKTLEIKSTAGSKEQSNAPAKNPDQPPSSDSAPK